jgi:hypothetical protein
MSEGGLFHLCEQTLAFVAQHVSSVPVAALPDAKFQRDVFRRNQAGSIPIFWMMGPAPGAVRNFTNALAASDAGAATCNPVE